MLKANIFHQDTIFQTSYLNQLSYLDGYFVVSGFSWRPLFGEHMLFLEWNSPDGSGCFPMFGEHYFKFSRQLYCRWCFSKLAKIASSLKLCSKCLCSPRGIKFRCSVEGCGSPFNVTCYGEPICEDSISKLCYDNHVIYLASFGSIIKIGVSREKRGGLDGGFIYRLLEQGVDAAVVFSGNLPLWEAQELELKISEEYSIPLSLNFEEKLEELMNGGKIPFDKLLKTALEIKNDLNGKVDIIWKNSFDWGSGPQDFNDILRGTEIFGDLVYAKGNIAFFDFCGEIYVLNVRNLLGRGIVCWEV